MQALAPPPAPQQQHHRSGCSHEGGAAKNNRDGYDKRLDAWLLLIALLLCLQHCIDLRHRTDRANGNDMARAVSMIQQGAASWCNAWTHEELAGGTGRDGHHYAMRWCRCGSHTTVTQRGAGVTANTPWAGCSGGNSSLQIQVSTLAGACGKHTNREAWRRSHRRAYTQQTCCTCSHASSH